MTVDKEGTPCIFLGTITFHVKISQAVLGRVVAVVGVVIAVVSLVIVVVGLVVTVMGLVVAVAIMAIAPRIVTRLGTVIGNKR